MSITDSFISSSTLMNNLSNLLNNLNSRSLDPYVFPVIQLFIRIVWNSLPFRKTSYDQILSFSIQEDYPFRGQDDDDSIPWKWVLAEIFLLKICFSINFVVIFFSVMNVFLYFDILSHFLGLESKNRNEIIDIVKIYERLTIRLISVKFYYSVNLREICINSTNIQEKLTYRYYNDLFISKNKLFMSRILPSIQILMSCWNSPTRLLRQRTANIVQAFIF